MKQRRIVNLALVVSTVGFATICFPPIDVALSAYVCWVPWFVLILREKQRGLLFWSWLVGLLFFYINTAWIRHVTYPAWLALGLYLSLYFPAFGVFTRFIGRNSCLPLTVTAPVGWIAQEYLRSFIITGFPWFYMGHTQYEHLSAIQLADLTGVYGISFVIVTVNACIAEVLCMPHRRRRRRRVVALVLWTALLVAGLYGYGAYRLIEYRPRVGPRVCVVQGNVPQSLKMSTDLDACREMLREYESTSMEARGEEIDLVVWPETMVPGYFNLIEYLDRLKDGDFTILAHESLDVAKRLSKRLDAPLLLGGQACETHGGELRTYNSAFYFQSDYFRDNGRIYGRYDKMHLVPFGEYVPFRRSLPFLTGILSTLAGYVPDFSPGQEPEVFRLGDHRFGVLICYEDTIAPLVRLFRHRNGEKQADFLLNISNDGWFCGSPELDQHLAVCAFRAVENRVGIARSVNTGISGFIAPNGRIEAVLERDGRRKLVSGALVRNVTLDDRLTFYTRYGEMFARVCFFAWCGMIAYAAVRHHRRGLRARVGPKKRAFFA